VLNQQLAQAVEAVQRDPSDAAARVVVASLYAENGKYDEAAHQYEESLTLNERNLPAINGLAEVYTKLGQSEKALPLLEKALTLGDGSKLVATSADMAEVRLHLAQIYLLQGRVQDAQVQAGVAIKNAPTNSDILLLLGQTRAAGGDFAGAVEQYKKALRFVPKFPEAYEALAAAYGGLGDRPRAAWAKAMVTYSRDDYAKAAGELEMLVRSDPRVAEAHLGLGMAYERLGKRDEAIAQYREALRLDPQLDYARQRLAGLGQG
jgi:tetratricopeptide (TPR) repeat protein